VGATGPCTQNGAIESRGELAMRVRTVLVILVLLLVAGFVAANLPAFTAPTTLSLLVARIEAPLGLVMLGLQGLVLGVFAVYVAMWQGAVLLQTLRHTKELQAQRALADQAEASRFTELRAVLHEEFERVAAQIGRTQEELRHEMRDHANSLAATLSSRSSFRNLGPRNRSGNFSRKSAMAPGSDRRARSASIRSSICAAC
jgi:uncharacterized integral membrane protein